MDLTKNEQKNRTSPTKTRQNKKSSLYQPDNANFIDNIVNKKIEKKYLAEVYEPGQPKKNMLLRTTNVFPTHKINQNNEKYKLYKTILFFTIFYYYYFFMIRKF